MASSINVAANTDYLHSKNKTVFLADTTCQSQHGEQPYS